MKKKLLLATSIIVPSLILGGLWEHQSQLFEKSISYQVSQLQETLKTYGLSFRYDDFRVSRYWFQAHLTNPLISGTLSQSIANLEALKGSEILKNFPDLEGHLSVKNLEVFKNLPDLEATAMLKGKMHACFSPFANAIIIKTEGDTHLTVHGSLEFDLAVTKHEQGRFIIQRKNYDFFGKNSFLSLHNIKGVSSSSKDISLLLNDQKLLSIKDMNSQISMNWDENPLDVSLDSTTNQMQFFKIENGIKGKLENIKDFNTALLNAMEIKAALGLQDQEISASFHVKDFGAYVNDIKIVFANAFDMANPQVFEKLIPEGIRLDIKNYSTKNKVYQTSVKGVFEKSNNRFPIKLSLDLKATDEWTEYWKNNFQLILNDLANQELPAELLAILKNNDFASKCMPELKAFGNILLSLDLNIPSTFPLADGKGALTFKSDPYEFALVGEVNYEGALLTVKTRNALSLMTDLENYVARIAQPLSEVYPLETQIMRGFTKGSQAVLVKVLEPSGATEQSLHIKADREGVRVCKYNFEQIMTLFSGPANESVQFP